MPVLLKVCGMGTFSVKSVRSWTLGRGLLVKNIVEYSHGPGYLWNLGNSGEFNVYHNTGAYVIESKRLCNRGN